MASARLLRYCPEMRQCGIGPAGAAVGIVGHESGVGSALGRAHEFRAADAATIGYRPPVRRGLGPPLPLWRLVLQLILPVLLLVLTGAAALVYGAFPVAWPGSAGWLTAGDLLVPLTFFAIALTNRRYGARHALIQTLAAWLLGGVFLLGGSGALEALTGRAMPSLGSIAACAGPLLAGHLLSVLILDRVRGPRWWVAPFNAVLWGGGLYAIVAVPLSSLGMANAWLGREAVYVGIMAAAAALLLLPYRMLRRYVPPLPGLGGY